MTRFLTGENIFLTIVAALSSITTYMGLRESLQEGVLTAGILSEVLAASLGLAIFVIIIFCWKFIQNIIQNGAYVAGAMLTLVWLPILFCASTLFSVIGISGGTASKAELTHSEQKWRNQVDAVFADRTQQVQTSLAAVTTTKNMLSELSTGEEHGLTTGMSGAGPVSRCYQRMSGALGQLEGTLTDKASALTRGHQETVAMIDTIAASRQSGLPTRELIAVYQTGGNQLQAAVADKATLGDLSRSVDATKQIMTCPEIEGLQEAQKLALSDIKTRMDAMTFTDTSTNNQKLVLDEVTPVYKAIFFQAEQVLPGWSIAIALDMLPFFLLVSAFIGSRQRALEAKGLELSLESLQNEQKRLEQEKNAFLAAFEADKTKITAEHARRFEEIAQQLSEAEARLEQKREEIALRTQIEGEFSPQARDALEGQLADRRDVIKSLREQIIVLDMQLGSKHDELARRADLTEVNQLLNKDAQRRRGEIESLSGQVIVLSSQRAAAEERSDALQAQVEELKKTLGAMQQESLQQDTKVLGLEAKAGQSQKWIETVEAARDEALIEANRLQVELLGSSDKLQTALGDLFSSGQKHATMRGHYEAQITSLHDQLQKAQASADEAERRLAVIHTQFRSDKKGATTDDKP